MKKYKYLNQSQKLLLAAMTIPLVASVLPITENVSANQIPNLNVYDLNGSPKLEWATEILQENILITDSFNNTTMFDLNENLSKKYSNTLIHNFDYVEKYEGVSSLRLSGTTNDRGNHYDAAKYTSAEESRIITSMNTRLNGIPDGADLSISIRVKNTDKAKFNLNIWDNLTDYGIPTDVYLKEAAFIGTNYVYVNKPEKLKLGQYILTSIPTHPGVFTAAFIKEIDLNTGKLTLSDNLQQNFAVNHEVKVHENPISADFEKTIDTNNDWTLINLNAKFGHPYHTASRGNRMQFVYQSESDIYIDELVIGYATEVEVYRDGQSIYKGFLADFHDTSIKDTVKPNKVEVVNTSISNDFNVKFNPLKPLDNGSKASYQIQSISKNGNRSILSSPQEIEVKSDVVKYRYNISNESDRIPSIETSSLNDLVIPLKSINLEKDYLHIQAIDANGNVSDIESFKLKELIDMQDIYNKIKELEDSNDYNDFVDFIDEIEELYGDNLPQDIKDKLEELGKHHGVNTSFLMLEEGDFRLRTADINDFGKVKLTAKKQTITSNFMNDFGVIDARGTQEGWHVTVSATPFTVETFDGFVGVPHQLPIGSLALNAINHVEQIGQVHNSQLPDVTMNKLTTIDGGNQTVNILNADKHKGMGEFKFTFTPNALALTVDAVTAKIDTVNYPDSNTPYTSTVTWDLVSGPQI